MMPKYQFYVATPREILGGMTFERKEAGIVEGEPEDAMAELRKRISATWSPFVIHSYKEISGEVSP